MWFVYALVAALFTGIGQVLVKKGQARLTPLLDNFLAGVVVYVIFLPALYFWGVNLVVDWKVVTYALIAATMYATFYYVMGMGEVSLMISLINTFPVVTITLAILFLREWPNVYQWLGILMVIGGVIYMSRETGDERKKTESKKWIVGGLLGALAIGIAEFITKLATAKVDGFTFTFWVFLMYLPPIVLFSLFDKKGQKFENLKNFKSLVFTVLGIVFIELGLIAIALAYQRGLASLVSPIVATHLLITAILAALFLKEKLGFSQRVGIVINLIGIAVIGLWS